MTRYPLVALDEVLVRERDEVPVQPHETYRTAGICSFGKGLFTREPLTGAETSYKSYFRLRAGQFVYSRLFAWEGAVAIVPPDFDGFFVSQEFPTFAIDASRADPSYLAALCRWPNFHEDLAGGTKGLGLRRQRVHPQQLLAIKVPLPDVEEQRRVSAKLDATLGRVVRIEELTSRTETIAGGLLASLVNSAAAPVLVGELVTQVERRETVDPQREYTLLGVRWYGEGLFVRERKPGYEVAATRLQRLRAGDFVYNRLFAWKGSFALVRSEHDGTHVSNEFPAFRVNEKKVLPEYLLAYFRTPVVWADALGRSTGGTPTSRNRLKEDRFLAMKIPLPPIEKQMIVVRRVGAIDHLVARRRAQAPAVEALTRSSLNRAFTGEL